MLVHMDEAKSRLSKLIAAAEAGDDVIIARGDKPVVRLVPVTATTFRFGSLAHLVKSVPDFDGAMEEVELVLWEGANWAV